MREKKNRMLVTRRPYKIVCTKCALVAYASESILKCTYPNELWFVRSPFSKMIAAVRNVHCCRPDKPETRSCQQSSVVQKMGRIHVSVFMEKC